MPISDCDRRRIGGFMLAERPKEVASSLSVKLLISIILLNKPVMSSGQLNCEGRRLIHGRGSRSPFVEIGTLKCRCESCRAINHP